MGGFVEVTERQSCVLWQIGGDEEEVLFGICAVGMTGANGGVVGIE